MSIPMNASPEALLAEVAEVIQNPEINAYKLDRKNHFFGVWLRHGGQYPDTQLRLFRQGKGSFANAHVHESLKIDGRIGKLKQSMEHYPYLTVSQYMKKFDFYAGFEAGFLWDKGVRPGFWTFCKYVLWKPKVRFFRRYILKGGFRDGVPGLFAALFDAMGWVTRYFKLWEKAKDHRTPKDSLH